MVRFWSVYKKWSPKTKIFFWSPLVVDIVVLAVTVLLSFSSKNVPANKSLVHTENQTGNNSIAVEQFSVASSPGTVIISGQSGGTTTVHQNFVVEDSRPKVSYRASIFNKKMDDGLYHSVFNIVVSGIQPGVNKVAFLPEEPSLNCLYTASGEVEIFDVLSTRGEARCISDKLIVDNGHLFNLIISP